MNVATVKDADPSPVAQTRRAGHQPEPGLRSRKIRFTYNDPRSLSVCRRLRVFRVQAQGVVVRRFHLRYKQAT
ncbi:hypothetical protein DAEQUDRAFT_299967 [Daedalea quercina L-15889]|uniref:Uncharacterized protein n=1 Tax=Daedalea quercina L-15889 TaxID=1314783 RepID=A0A165Q5B8_9APHY|nr:hypothetical protein DAEQUDRAFT_299967 [Daedalea quercina L-15889]